MAGAILAQPQAVAALDRRIGGLEPRRKLLCHVPVFALVDRSDEGCLQVEALDDVELELRLERREVEKAGFANVEGTGTNADRRAGLRALSALHRGPAAAHADVVPPEQQERVATSIVVKARRAE